jgi:type IV pilus assembly protein PilO
MDRLREFIKENQPLVFLAIIVIVLLVLYFFYIDKPLLIKIKQARQELLEKKQESARLKEEVINLPALKEAYEKIKEKLVFVEERLPRKEEMPELLRTITETAAACGIEFTTFTPKPPISKELYDEIPIELSVRGTYHNLALFLARLGKLERIIVPLACNISAYSPKEKEKASVQTNLTIKTFIYKAR